MFGDYLMRSSQCFSLIGTIQIKKLKKKSIIKMWYISKSFGSDTDDGADDFRWWCEGARRYIEAMFDTIGIVDQPSKK